MSFLQVQRNPLNSLQILPVRLHRLIIGRSALRKISTPSCTLCRRRKIKCDRSDPCAPCVRAGAVCITPAPSRAPRGRKGGRRKYDGELLDRIAKLESLVERFERGPAASTSAVPAAADGNQAV